MRDFEYEKSIVRETDNKALEKAKQLEKNKKKDGYEWVHITPTLSIFVQFKDGKPTEKAKRIIEMHKKMKSDI